MEQLLLRMAEQVLDQVLQQFSQQLNVVAEQAIQPMQGTVSLVEGGAWRGIGAEQFKQEVASIFMPNTGIVRELIAQQQSNLNKARDIIKQADQSAHQAVQDMDNLFGQIATF
jgi:hypothetical protein